MSQQRLLWEVVRDLKDVRRGAMWISEGCGYLRKAFQVERTAGAEAPSRSIKNKASVAGGDKRGRDEKTTRRPDPKGFVKTLILCRRRWRVI